MTFRGGAACRPSQWALLRMAARLLRREYLFIPRKGGWMRHEGSGWDRSFFWQFVNGTHGTADCLKRVVPLVTPAFSARSSPCCWRHSLPPFLFLAGIRT